MKFHNIKKAVVAGCVGALCFQSCTKLNTPVYSGVESDNYWQTETQFIAGVAPIYTQMQNLVIYENVELSEVSTDEMIVPTRGNDWYDNGNHQRIYLHTWTVSDGFINTVWSNIFTGIGRCNYVLNVVENLTDVPSTIDVDEYIAEIRIMRAYYYLQALDYFGNVPLVSDYNTDPNTVTNSTSTEIYNFIESELEDAIPDVSSSVNDSTYGRANKWTGYAVLAKLYLNAEVYTGTAQWAKCAAACDSIILSGNYSLESVFFDNFAVDNEGSTENIFVVPFDSKYIANNKKEYQTLHYSDLSAFGLLSGMWNGWCTHGDFLYGNFDTTAVYSTTSDGRIYKTYNDQRTGQFLTGQRYTETQSYPQSTRLVYSSTGAISSDGAALAYEPNFTELSNSTVAGKVVGARNIKYFPEAGTGGGTSQSNDVVVYRLADILLMRAEATFRGASVGSTGTALALVNQIRERAYGSSSYDWTATDVTAANILAERARELSWEGWRRQDLIRFDVADGTVYYTGARGGTRSPAKTADAGTYTRLYPIPEAQHSANANLVQNPGYASF
ncbi:MAG: RagB/SusD family nutrient uptake outer membrane protein [Chitinophagaceae bacterium]